MSQLMIHLAHKCQNQTAFKTACENFIQAETKKIMRLEAHQARALYDAYPTAKEDVLADLLALGMDIPDTMLVYAKRVVTA